MVLKETDFILQNYLSGNIFVNSVCDKLFRKEILEKLRFPEGYSVGEDMYFQYQVLKKVQKIAIDTTDSKYMYIIREESTMTNRFNDRFFDTIELSKKIVEENKGNNEMFCYAKAHEIHETCKVLEYMYLANAEIEYKKERDKFNDVAQEYTDNYIIINKKFALLSPMAFALMSVVITLIIFFGAMKVLNNTLEIGSITAIVEYSLTTIAALIMSSMVLVQMPKAVVSIERIEEVLNVTSEIKDKEELKDNSYYEDILKQNPISLTFDNVCFRYKGAEKQILKNISFSIKAGERFAIVGATGSGKSTIAKVLLRLNDIESGRILINGVDALDLPLNCLRNQISYTPQKAYIFSGKIKDNFRFTNKNMTDEEMIKIAKIAQSYDFIDSLPDKFDSFVAQGGINFSGGQKQRLSIARALSKDANIYLFDDSFSALDYATDAKLRKELKTFLKDKITIIIAQRLNTIADADKIIVLKDSEITGMGTHQELLESNQEYIELAKSQGILE